MRIPLALFEVLLWAALAGVALAAAYLLSALVYEWKRKELW